MVVHFNRLKLCPASVRCSTDGLQNDSYRQDGDVVGSPVNIEDSSSRQRCIPVQGRGVCQDLLFLI